MLFFEHYKVKDVREMWAQVRVCSTSDTPADGVTLAHQRLYKQKAE